MDWERRFLRMLLAALVAARPGIRLPDWVRIGRGYWLAGLFIIAAAITILKVVAGIPKAHARPGIHLEKELKIEDGTKRCICNG